MIQRKVRLAMAAMAATCLTCVPTSAQQTSGYDRVSFVAAVAKEDASKVRELLDKYGKSILNAQDNSGDTPLTISIRKRHDWAYYFLKEGANPNQPGAQGDTPLIVAARVGFTGIAEHLIALKADVNGKNRRGETPLIVAVQARQAPIVKLLLEAGANPDQTDNFGGRSARDYAKQNSRDKELLKLIESTGAKPAKAKTADEFKL